jgi:hypothetical protein
MRVMEHLPTRSCRTKTLLLTLRPWPTWLHGRPMDGGSGMVGGGGGGIILRERDAALLDDTS